MNSECLKCGYVRNDSDPGPDSECPRCGAIYAKIKAMHLHREPGGSPEPEEPTGASSQGKDPSSPPDDMVHDIALLIQSSYGLIWLKSDEDDRVEAILKHLADFMKLHFFTWSLNHGLCRVDFDKPVYGTTDPKLALDHIIISGLPAIYHFQGLGPFLEDKMLAAKLLDAAKAYSKGSGAIILTGGDINLPESIKPYAAEVSPPPPDRGSYLRLVQNILRDIASRMPVKTEMTRSDLNRLLNNLKGLTLLEAGKILTKAIIEDRRLSPEDIQSVIEAKKKVVEQDGLLEYYPAEESLADIADMANLKAWLAKRKAIITDPHYARDYGLTFPKGILLLGVPGSGKSLCAKAVSMEWGLPLLKMDPSNLYNKYIGESEKNFKRAMETAEKMAPVVLWIDEIEKAFSSGGGEDGGVSQRVLGTFLSWMQDRKGDVFVVATANDVAKLPPEFLRKGRFDEVFFVDLPDIESRSAIFSIHLKRKKRDPAKFDIARLAEAAEGFSGAEIEQVVVSALYTAFSRKTDLTTDLLLTEIDGTQPLAKTRSEQIDRLRAWAIERTVNAG
jgi:hypothetical protein